MIIFGLEIVQASTPINVFMDSYISQIVKIINKEKSHKQTTPIMDSPYVQLLSCENDKLDEADASFYRSIIGTIVFAAYCLKYDICFAVGLLSHFLQTHEKNHLSAAK